MMRGPQASQQLTKRQEQMRKSVRTCARIVTHIDLFRTLANAPIKDSETILFIRDAIVSIAMLEFTAILEQEGGRRYTKCGLTKDDLEALWTSNMSGLAYDQYLIDIKSIRDKAIAHQDHFRDKLHVPDLEPMLSFAVNLHVHLVALCDSQSIVLDSRRDLPGLRSHMSREACELVRKLTNDA
ncbi:MAG: hypothetical protein AMXMBFR81_04770 [Chthonomonas sp.]